MILSPSRHKKERMYHFVLRTAFLVHILPLILNECYYLVQKLKAQKANRTYKVRFTF